MKGLLFISKKKIRKACWWVLFIITAALCFQFLGLNAAVPITSRKFRLIPIYYVETGEKKVALSFDACWGDSSLLRTILCGHSINSQINRQI